MTCFCLTTICYVEARHELKLNNRPIKSTLLVLSINAWYIYMYIYVVHAKSFFLFVLWALYVESECVPDLSVFKT